MSSNFGNYDDDDVFDPTEPGTDLDDDLHASRFGDSEEAREERILHAGMAGVPFCVECGCTDENACPGGCVWATADTCSRCVLTGAAGSGR